MSGVNLAPDHAVELTELLEFLNAWLTSDHDQLDASLHRYVGHPAYNIDRLKADLARCTLTGLSPGSGTSSPWLAQLPPWQPVSCHNSRRAAVCASSCWSTLPPGSCRVRPTR